jgi:hypothetical protein
MACLFVVRRYSRPSQSSVHGAGVGRDVDLLVAIFSR